MNQTLQARLVAFAVAVLTVPMAALADLSQTTLQPNSSLNLDTGAVAGSGGDLLWNGSTLVPQGSAKVRNLGLPESYWVSIAPGGSSTRYCFQVLARAPTAAGRGVSAKSLLHL